jgi:hypothetical protein
MKIQNNSNYPNQPQNLSVKLLDEPSEYTVAARTMQAWANIARLQGNIASGEDKEHFASCEEIARGTAGMLSSMQSHDELFVCEDGFGRPQGYMVLNTSGQSVVVEMMFTHPHNIKSPLNPSRIAGVGTKLMQEAEEIALDGRWFNGVVLTSFTDALPFYEKLGYRPLNPRNSTQLFKSTQTIQAQRSDPAA